MYSELSSDVSPDQDALRAGAHRFATEVLRPVSLELDRCSAAEVVAPGSKLWDVFKAWKEMNQGLEPEGADEGEALDPLAQHLVFEEVGWGASDLAISLGVSAMPFTAAGEIGQLTGNQAVLDEIVTPYRSDSEAAYIGCWAITEPAHGSDSLGTLGFESKDSGDPKASGTCRARQDGGDWVVSGQKSAWVSNGSIASHALLFCALEPTGGTAGGGVFIVPLNLPGVSRGAPLEKHGQRALNQGEIFFDEVRVPGSYLLAGPDLYAMVLEMTLATANTGMSVVFTGAARSGLEEALSYARNRVQGGKAITGHQMIQGKIFNMFARVEQARALSRATMRGLGPGVGRTGLPHAIAAKVSCTETAFAVASDAVQVHGGMGLAKGMWIEKLLRDTRSALIEDGVNEFLGLVAAQQVINSYAVD